MVYDWLPTTTAPATNAAASDIAHTGRRSQCSHPVAGRAISSRTRAWSRVSK